MINFFQTEILIFNFVGHLETPIFDESLFNESMKNCKVCLRWSDFVLKKNNNIQQFKLFKDICKAGSALGFSTTIQTLYKDVMLKKREPGSDRRLF